MLLTDAAQRKSFQRASEGDMPQTLFSRHLFSQGSRTPTLRIKQALTAAIVKKLLNVSLKRFYKAYLSARVCERNDALLHSAFQSTLSISLCISLKCILKTPSIIAVCAFDDAIISAARRIFMEKKLRTR